jgi:hypothetical protein
MDDHLGLGLGHRLCDRVRVERVGHDRPRAEAAQQVLLVTRAGHADDLVATGDQLRHEPAPEHPGCSCDEHLHGVSFFVSSNH